MSRDYSYRATESSRRSVLRATAGVTGGLIVGATTTNSVKASSDGATEDVPADATVVDVEAESSIDEDGDLGAEIQAYCDGLSTVNHAFVVPSGTYSWNTEVRLSGSTFFGLVGDGRPTFEVREFVDFLVFLGTGRNGFGEVLLQDFVIDIDGTDPYGNEIDAGVCNVFAEDDALIEDIELVGKRRKWHEDERVGGVEYEDTGYYYVGRAYTVRLDMVTPDGEGTVRNVALPDGAVHTYAREVYLTEYWNGDREQRAPGEGIAFSSDEFHEGTIRWENCYAEEYLGNSFYTWSNAITGKNILENCDVVNGYRCAIRIGVNDEAYDCTVTLDDVNESYHSNTTPTGLWMGEGTESDRLPYAENITIVAPEGMNDLVRFNSSSNGGHITGLDVRAPDDNSGPLIDTSYNSDTVLRDILIEDFTITDTSESVSASGVQIDRPHVEFRNGSFEFGGVGDGISVNGSDTRLDSVDIDVTNGGEAIAFDDSNLEMVDTHVEGEADNYATITLESGFDWDSAHVEGNSFEYVELVDNSGEGVTLSDLEGGETDSDDDWVDLGSDTETSQVDNESGVLFRTKEELSEIRCRLSQNTADHETAYLRDSSAEIVAQTDISTLSSGETFVLSPSGGLDASNTFSVTIDADGEYWYRGEDQNPSYPYENDLLEVTDGVYTASQTTTSNVRYGITEIRAVEDAGGWLDLQADDDSSQVSNESGILFRSKEELPGISCRISQNTEDHEMAYLRDSSAEIVTQTYISNVSAGETFELAPSGGLDASNTYSITIDGDGEYWYRGEDQDPSYPYENDLLEVTDGVYTASQTTTSNVRYGVSELRVLDENERTVDRLNLRADDDSSQVTNESGVLFQPKEDLSGIRGRISQNTEDHQTAYLRDSSAEIVAQTDISTLSSGETFELSPSGGLDGANTYSVTIDADGEYWYRGEDQDPSYPYENDLFEVTDGVYTASQTTTSNVRYGITELGGIRTS